MNEFPSNLSVKRGLGFETDEVEITVATNAGACFGVVRAIKLGYQAVGRAQQLGDSAGKVYSFGALIHNPQVVGDLERRGVKTISSTDETDEADKTGGGTVILRSHGIRREIEADLKQRGLQVVDATCPLVKKPQRIAQSLGEKGYFLVIVGDSKHPEVQGVLSYFGRPDHKVVYHPDETDTIPAEVSRVGVIAQTTIEVRVFDTVVDRLKTRFSDVVAYNTICDATSVRQTEARRLAENADVLVVVGGKNSSNTAKLVKICKDFQKDTYHIEEIDEIQSHWFHNKRKIGVTAGASTPHEYVDEVGNHIARLIQAAQRAPE